jgi:cytochrome c
MFNLITLRLGRSRTRTAIVAAVLLAVSAGTPRAQDVEKGKASFRKCVLCHSIGENAKNKVGPELNGLDGRSAGSVQGFLYSDAHAHSAIMWNETTFKRYIKDPRAMVPGTKKAFAGLNDEHEAEDLWAYIRQFDADGNIKK